MPRTSLVKEAESLLAELDRAATSRAAVDERRDRRTPFRRSLKLERRNSAGSKVESWIYARDLSSGGLGCLGVETLETGTSVTVHLPAEGGGDGVTDEIQASVVHSRRLKQEWQVLGLKFNVALDPERYVIEKE